MAHQATGGGFGLMKAAMVVLVILAFWVLVTSLSRGGGQGGPRTVIYLVPERQVPQWERERREGISFAKIDQAVGAKLNDWNEGLRDGLRNIGRNRESWPEWQPPQAPQSLQCPPGRGYRFEPPPCPPRPCPPPYYGR